MSTIVINYVFIVRFMLKACKKRKELVDLRLKLRLIDAKTSPCLFLALTRYSPASDSTTLSNSRTTKYLFVAIFEVLKIVRLSAVSSRSPRNHVMSGWGPPTSWHSKMSRFPSSSCLSLGFCVKAGTDSSDAPILFYFFPAAATSVAPLHSLTTHFIPSLVTLSVNIWLIDYYFYIKLYHLYFCISTCFMSSIYRYGTSHYSNFHLISHPPSSPSQSSPNQRKSTWINSFNIFFVQKIQ